MLYSSSMNSFYDLQIHGMTVPSDSVEVGFSEWQAIMEGQAAGKVIQPNEWGRPELAEPVVPQSDYFSQVAERRNQAEMSGAVYEGIRFPTDQRGQNAINGAALAVMLNCSYCCRWKTTNGFVDVDAERILRIASAVRTHVQTCFDREAELLTHLEAGTFTESMLDEGWPN